MQFNPNTGSSSDDETWRDLVARLQEPQDAFMHDGGTSGQGSSVDGEPREAGATGEPSEPSETAEEFPAPPKGVADFDPLGVWQQHLLPAPTEATASERAVAAERATTGAGTAGPRDYEAPEDDEEGFVPEEPPSLLTSDPAILLSWLGATGGPLFLVFAAIFWRNIPLTLTIGVILAFLAGTGYLLSRLPDHHDGGDGAVV